jgi:phenylalanine-4-hydroxylase
MTPWFPKCLSDTDAFAERVLECGEDLAADHPGFTDQVYRARRADITNIAKQYKTYNRGRESENVNFIL